LRVHLLIAISAAAWVGSFGLLAAQDELKDEIDLGITALGKENYQDAVIHCENALRENQNKRLAVGAHFCLAKAFAGEYIPGMESDENKRLGEAAVSEYQKVLEIESELPLQTRTVYLGRFYESKSLEGIADLYLQMKQFDNAKSFLRRAIDVDPAGAENYFSMAVVDWSIANAARTKVRAELKLIDQQPLIDRPDCWGLRSSNEETIKDGMSMVAKALDLRHEYDDAMAYMNLLYRERADIQCSDRGSFASDLKAADHWADLSISIKKARSNEKVIDGWTDP